MTTLEFIFNKYQIPSDTPDQIKLQCTRWATIPRLFKQLGFKVGAEIGVLDGNFAYYLLKYNPGSKLYAVDPWASYQEYIEFDQNRLDEAYRLAREKLGQFNCQFIRDYSMNAVKWFADETLDYVYIDAAHDYTHVKEDVIEWAKKVKHGGIISGHDFYNGSYKGENNDGKITTYGVKQAVYEYLDENKIKYLFRLRKKGDSSWFFVKP